MNNNIVVVGAGMIGLAAALALAQQEFSVTLIEARPFTAMDLPTVDSPFDTRVVAVSRASEKLLDNLGIWQTIQATRSLAYEHMMVWDNEADGKIHFSAVDFFEPNLGHIIEHKVIVGALWQALQNQPHVRTVFGTALRDIRNKENHIEVVLDSQETLRAALVIGADGAHSSVRKIMEIGTKGWHYGQSAIIATVKGAQSHQHTAFQRFSPEGPLALLPLAEKNHSSIVWTTTPVMAQKLCQMPIADFNVTLTREITGVMGEMQLVGERVAIPLKTHHATCYATPRCVLIGDAAHTLHPLAGQGVNLGFMDVASLVKNLCEAKNKKRDVGALRILSRYERERKMHNQAMIWGMELFKRGFGSRQPAIQALRNYGLNWVDQKLALKQFFVKLAMGT